MSVVVDKNEYGEDVLKIIIDKPVKLKIDYDKSAEIMAETCFLYGMRTFDEIDKHMLFHKGCFQVDKTMTCKKFKNMVFIKLKNIIESFERSEK